MYTTIMNSSTIKKQQLVLNLLPLLAAADASNDSLMFMCSLRFLSCAKKWPPGQRPRARQKNNFLHNQ